MQLLSLHGKAEVLVERLQLTVIEDHGGTGLPRYIVLSHGPILYLAPFYLSVAMSSK